MRKTIMITGGLGFIGSNLVRHWLMEHPLDHVVNVDAMTYAARPEWIAELFEKHPRLEARYDFERADITDHASVVRLMHKWKPDHIIHLAAESHVCRSISGPKQFINTNIMGTFHLLEEFKNLWGNAEDHRFHHVSTDEVFGQLGPHGKFTEETRLQPRSPYSGSKAASDLLVQVYAETYGLNTVITNCSNNFGPNQHEEKLIPRAIEKILKGEAMTVYQGGHQVRDWLFVDDHCSAIDCVFHHGDAGERYCIGGDVELKNLEVIQKVHAVLRSITGRDLKLSLVHTEDRPTDDFRYAVDVSKIEKLRWKPYFMTNFEECLEETCRWYIDHMDIRGVPK